jgi:hypothetical protein
VVTPEKPNYATILERSPEERMIAAEKFIKTYGEIAPSFTREEYDQFRHERLSKKYNIL